MEITEHRTSDTLELHITGRLDSSWAEPLARRLDEVIREGAHHLRLNLAAIDYISSAGIRVLVKFHRQLHGMQGSFAISLPSEPVQTVLELAGLATPSNNYEHTELIEMVNCDACVQAVQGMTDAEVAEFAGKMRETDFFTLYRNKENETIHPLDILRAIRQLGYRVTKASP